MLIFRGVFLSLFPKLPGQKFRCQDTFLPFKLLWASLRGVHPARCSLGSVGKISTQVLTATTFCSSKFWTSFLETKQRGVQIWFKNWFYWSNFVKLVFEWFSQVAISSFRSCLISFAAGRSTGSQPTENIYIETYCGWFCYVLLGVRDFWDTHPFYWERSDCCEYI